MSAVFRCALLAFAALAALANPALAQALLPEGPVELRALQAPGPRSPRPVKDFVSAFREGTVQA